MCKAGQRRDLVCDHPAVVQIKSVKFQRSTISGTDSSGVDLKDTGLIMTGDFQETYIAFPLIIFIFI